MKLAKPKLKTAEYRTVKPAPKKADDFYRSTEWQSLIAWIIRRRGRRCEECGRENTRIFGDHTIEIRDGGDPLDETNVRLLCGSCHTAKTAAMRVARLNGEF